MRGEGMTWTKVPIIMGILGLLSFACLGSTRAQPPVKDSGLITGLEGEVSYSSGGRSNEFTRAEAFMKVRVGDTLMVEPGGWVRIVFFQGNREELWKGPAVFKVGETRGEPEAGSLAEAEVTVLPSGASKGIQRVPALLKRAGLSRAGAMQVRGGPGAEGTKASGSEAALSAQEQAEIQRAKEIYREMRRRSVADDLTPELFLLGVLSDYEQYSEMEVAIADALSRKPGDVLLEQLAAWVKRQKEGKR